MQIKQTPVFVNLRNNSYSYLYLAEYCHTVNPQFATALKTSV